MRLNLGGQEVDLHLRVTGSGPAVFLLHPSPLSSAFLQPLAAQLAAFATVICPDTPGYGDSDALPDHFGDATVAPYVDAFKALATALGLDQFVVYGSATGAQIAVEWAKSDRRVVGTVLDNAAHFEDDERRRIQDGYFPDVTPDADGGHIARVWRLAHDSTLFFPWHRQTEDNRIARSPGPVAAMDATFNGYLRAGPGYERAYRAAFANERATQLQAIDSPVRVIRWPAGLLARFTDRFDDYAWGDNVVMVHCDAEPTARFAAIEASIRDRLPSHAARLAEPEPGRLRFVSHEGGQLAWRAPVGEVDRLVLPGFGGGLASLDKAWLKPGDAVAELPTTAGALASLREAIGAVPIVSFGLAHRWLLAEFGQLAPQAIGDWPDEPWPDLTPEASGAHWWRLWAWLRQHWLTSDEPVPEPAQLTRLMLDTMALAEAHLPFKAGALAAR